MKPTVGILIIHFLTVSIFGGLVGCSSIAQSRQTAGNGFSAGSRDGHDWVNFRLPSAPGLTKEASAVRPLLDEGWKVVNDQGLPGIAREMVHGDTRLILLRAAIGGGFWRGEFEKDADVKFQVIYMGIHGNKIDVVGDRIFSCAYPRESQDILQYFGESNRVPYYFAAPVDTDAARASVKEFAAAFQRDDSASYSAPSLDGSEFDLLIVDTPKNRRFFLGINGNPWDEDAHGTDRGNVVDRKLWKFDELFRMSWAIFQPEKAVLAQPEKE